MDTASLCGREAEDTDLVQDSCPGRRCGYHWSHGSAKGAYLPLEASGTAEPGQAQDLQVSVPLTSKGPLRSGTQGHQLSNPGQVMLEFPFLTSPRGPEATCLCCGDAEPILSNRVMEPPYGVQYLVSFAGVPAAALGWPPESHSPPPGCGEHHTGPTHRRPRYWGISATVASDSSAVTALLGEVREVNLISQCLSVLSTTR